MPCDAYFFSVKGRQFNSWEALPLQAIIGKVMSLIGFVVLLGLKLWLVIRLGFLGARVKNWGYCYIFELWIQFWNNLQFNGECRAKKLSRGYASWPDLASSSLGNFHGTSYIGSRKFSNIAADGDGLTLSFKNCRETIDDVFESTNKSFV